MNDDVRRVMKVVDRPPVVMVEGRGSWLWDRDGKKYLDFVQGWAAIDQMIELLRTSLTPA